MKAHEILKSILVSTRRAYVIFFCCLCLCIAWGTFARGDEPLRVGVVGDPPFVIENGPFYTGIAVDFWDEISRGLKKPYIFVDVSDLTVDQHFQLLEEGKVDVLIGGLSVLPYRYKVADFTLPFYIDKVVAIVPLNFIDTAFLFIRMFFISTGGILLLFFLFFIIYINLLWYYENVYSKKIPHTYKEGIAHIFWSHILRGAHSEIPVSVPGKILVLFQKTGFTLSIIMLNAVVVSFLTVSLSQYSHPIQKLGDLESKKIGAVKGTKSFYEGTSNGLRVIPFSSLKEGIKALKDGKITAFLEDFAAAEYYLTSHGIADLSISTFELKQDPYSFATRKGSSLLREINVELIKLRKNEITTKICKQYLIQGIENCDL